MVLPPAAALARFAGDQGRCEEGGAGSPVAGLQALRAQQSCMGRLGARGQTLKHNGGDWCAR